MKIMKFGATWCGPCKSLDKVISESQYASMVEKIDIDDHPEYAAKYGIRSVPVMIKFDDNDQEISRKSGSMTPTQLTDFFEQ